MSKMTASKRERSITGCPRSISKPTLSDAVTGKLDLGLLRLSGFEQAPEECSVALKSQPQVFCRDVFLSIPLGLETATDVGEVAGEMLHELRHKSVCIAHGSTRLVHEIALDFLPAGEKGNPIALLYEGHLRLGCRGKVAVK